MGFYDPKTGIPKDTTYHGPDLHLPKGLHPKAEAEAVRAALKAHTPVTPPKPPSALESAYERYFSNPLTHAATPVIHRLMQTPPVLKGQPSPLDLTKYVAPETIAKGIVPQTVPEAGMYAGMLLGGPAGVIGRIGAGALGSGLGELATGGHFTPGTVKGAMASALAELPLIPFRPGLYASMAQRDFGEAVSKVLELPELSQALKKAQVNVIESFRRGKIADVLGAKAQQTYDSIYTTFGKRPVFRLPTKVPGRFTPATWDEVRNALTKLSKKGWTGIGDKAGGEAFDARKLREKIAEHAMSVIDSYDHSLANEFAHVNELWNKYYALDDLVKKVDFRPEGGRFQRLGGQRQFSKDSAKLRRKLGDVDFNRIERSLFGGETAHAGFDRPGALSRRGIAPGTLVESSTGVRGYMRAIPTHEKPLTSQFVGKSPISLTLLRMLGLLPANRTIEKVKAAKPQE